MDFPLGRQFLPATSAPFKTFSFECGFLVLELIISPFQKIDTYNRYLCRCNYRANNKFQAIKGRRFLSIYVWHGEYYNGIIIFQSPIKVGS